MSPPSPGTGPWVLRSPTGGPPERRLLCLPHAGGGASFFRQWAADLPETVEVWAVQYPGRENRFSEPVIDDLHELVDGLHEALDPLLDGPPLALFGHSMGASVAHELARRLEQDRPGLVVTLFVSARPSPARQAARRSAVHRLDDDGLASHVSRLGGTAREVMADPELRELLLPVIRNDFRLIERYQADDEPLLDAPIVALTGAEDPSMAVDDARSWADATRGPFQIEVFPGGHFYLVPERSAVLALVGRHLTRQETCP